MPQKEVGEGDVEHGLATCNTAAFVPRFCISILAAVSLSSSGFYICIEETQTIRLPFVEYWNIEQQGGEHQSQRKPCEGWKTAITVRATATTCIFGQFVKTKRVKETRLERDFN